MTDIQKARAIVGLGEIWDRYDAILCDIWGVVHNGRKSYPQASAALAAFRKRGGAVVLITNAPRPNAPIREQLIKLGVSPDAFDDIVTSGDVTLGLIAERIAEPLHHIGAARDLSLFSAAETLTGQRPALVSPEDAAYVVCTGLENDEIETPADYEARLVALAARGLDFVCANPDIIIHRGTETVFCAGALARRYAELGGRVIYAGKPYAPIYWAALGAAERALKRKLDPARALAIGDGMHTDIAGALGQGLDALFVSGGIHLDEVHGGQSSVEEALEALFARERRRPFATTRALGL